MDKRWKKELEAGVLCFRFLVLVATIPLFLLLFLPCAAMAGESENMLKNGSFEAGKGERIPGWMFSAPKASGEIETGIDVCAAEGKQSLRISAKDADAHIWWYQEVPVLPQTKYQLSLSAKAEVKEGSDYFVLFICYYKDADGAWIKADQAIEVGQDQKQWPAAKNVPPSDWKRFTATITTPPKAVTMGVRCSLGCRDGSTLTVWYDDVQVKQMVSKTQAVDIAPGSLDVLMEQGSLPSGASWDIKQAARDANEVRERICINGFWRFQPEFAYGQPPRPDQWSYLRVPGVWIDPWGAIIFKYHGADGLDWYEDMMDYRLTGWDAKRWEGEDLSKFCIGWYERLVEIPDHWRGRRVYIDFTAIDRIATVYLNGKSVGVLEVPGGEITLPSERIRYGETNVITVRVVGSDYPGRHTYFLRAGWGSGLKGDVFLCSVPQAVKISDVFAIPSVRKENLTIKATVEAGGDRNGLRFRTVVGDESGNIEVDHLSEPKDVNAGSNGVILTIPWKAKQLWSPSSPHLYKLEIAAIGEDGKVLDKTLPVDFGFREFWIEGRWFYLNGYKFRLRPYLFIGHSYGCHLTKEAVRRNLIFHKQMGFNAVEVRGSWLLSGESMSYFDEFLRQADRLGMAVLWQLESVQDDDQYRGFDDLAVWRAYRRRALEVPIVRLRNHPSIFMWSPSMNFNCNRLEVAPWLLGQNPDLARRDEGATRAQMLAKDTIRELDPTRETFFHDAANLGPIASYNYHFNFPPLQEREEYPSNWAKEGIKPLMMVESADCFVGNFQKKRAGESGADGEPLATEYLAMYLGPKAYHSETQEYIAMVENRYRGDGTWPREQMYHVIRGLPGYRELATMFTERTRRSWRAWGVPGGLLPWYCLGDEENYGGERVFGPLEVEYAPSVNFQAPGVRIDRWDRIAAGNKNTTIYTYPGLPEEYPAAEFKDANYIYHVMRKVNMPLMVYLGGSEERFTARDHGYFAGETVEKQIVAVWDGADSRNLMAKWRVITPDGKELDSGQTELYLEPGDIEKVAIEFKAPKVDSLQKATIELETFENGELLNHSWCRDKFNVEFYPRPGPVHSDAEIVVYDPKGLTQRWLKETGLRFEVVDASVVGDPLRLRKRLEGVGLFIIGREGMSRELLSACQPAVLSGLSVVVFEQGAEVLQSLGFRTLDIGSRYTFSTSEDSPFLKGIPEEGLCNWRGSSTLVDPYPMTLEPPAGKVQPYRWGNYGTVSTVVIEKPHFGTFTPVLDAEFDLRYSPLLLWRLGRGQVLFCQLDITGRYAKEPVATLFAHNILQQMQKMQDSHPYVASVPALTVGEAARILTEKLGFETRSATNAGTLMQDHRTSAVLIGDDLSPQELAAYRKPLADYVQAGGRAICLSLDGEQLKSVTPFPIAVTRAKISRTALSGKAAMEAIFEGLSSSDLHYRGSIETDLITEVPKTAVVDDTGCLAVVSFGNGQYIFCQLAPNDVSPNRAYVNAYQEKVSADFLRYSEWHVYRTISQILTNADVNMSPERLAAILNGSDWTLDLSGMWKVTYSPENTLSQQRQQYTRVEYDDSAWSELREILGQWPVQGHEEVFSHRDPADRNSPYSIWYRKTVEVPVTLKGEKLQLYLGVIDDADETYFNGHKVGEISRENSAKYWEQERIYNIPPEFVNYGGKNVIAFRMTDYQGGWGAFIHGPAMYLSLAGGDDTTLLYAERLKVDDNPYRVCWW